MSKKLTGEQISDLVDIVTSDHPEFTDVAEVRAAVEHAAKENPHLTGAALAQAAAAFLKEIEAPAEDAQPLAGMPQEALDGLKAETVAEAQEVSAEPAGEPVVHTPALEPGQTVTITNTGDVGSVTIDRSATGENYLAQELKNLSAENHMLLRENRELRKQIEHMRVAGHIPSFPQGASTTTPPPAPFYNYTVTVNNASLVPEKYKSVDGKIDLAMIHADVNAAGGPKVVPGCLIGRKQ